MLGDNALGRTRHQYHFFALIRGHLCNQGEEDDTTVVMVGDTNCRFEIEKPRLILQQPPKRKQPAASTSKSKPTAKRRSKLAKEHDITAEEESEIQEAFALFAQQDDGNDSKEGVIATSDVRRCLIALNAPPTDKAELQELLETVDPEKAGWVSYEHFVAIAALKLHAKHDDPNAETEEVVKAYNLFTEGEQRDINLNDLRRIAKELREEVPDNVLKDMVREATGGGLGGVGMDDFESVMRRAGVFT